MGNSGPDHVKGGMQIQVENRSCQVGDEIMGAINVMLQEHLPPSTLILQIKGVEKTE